MWNRRQHPNILPLLGVSDQDFLMVSEWMENGNIKQYILAHPDANLPSLVSDPFSSYQMHAHSTSSWALQMA
jgi:hypothetical protein